MAEIRYSDLKVASLTDLPDYERMEYAGRVCYQSQDKIKDGSAKQFLLNIRQRGHYSVLGHAQLLVTVSQNDAIDVEALCPFHLRNQFVFHLLPDGMVLVGAGYDAWLQLFEAVELPMAQAFKDKHPIIFGGLDIMVPDEYANPPQFTRTDSVALDVMTASYMFKETFSIKADRATAMQLRTYRYATHSIESQRYVNYNKKGFVFIKPPEFEEGTPAFQLWEDSVHAQANFYMQFIERGFKPEVARGALGQDIVAEHIITANLWEWKHIFDMRLNTATQSNTRAVVQMIKDYLVAKYKGSPLEQFLRGEEYGT